MHADVVEETGSVGRELFDGDRAFSGFGLSVAAKIGDDEAIFGGKHGGERQPETMIDRRGMEENDGRAVSLRGEKQLRVAGVEEHGLNPLRIRVQPGTGLQVAERRLSDQGRCGW